MKFLDSLAFNSYLPYFIQHSRYTSHSKTLINNIFSNVTLKYTIPGKFSATISDHLPQFLISPNDFANPVSSKPNDIDWPYFLNLDVKILDLITKSLSWYYEFYTQ